jgi:heme exporter protein D
MLYIVLTLVIAAFGLLVTALTTAETFFAWISVGVSVAAATLLIVDWVASHRRLVAASVSSQELASERGQRRDAAGSGGDPEMTDVLDRVAPDDGFTEEFWRSAPKELHPDEEPAVEPTDTADLMLIAGLADEVLVMDERPRYHLTSCGWLSRRPAIAIPVGEARQLGFTPCAYCGPDRVLAARHRAGSGGAR